MTSDTSSINIVAIGSYIPDTMIDNLERAESFNRDQDFVTEKLGFLKLARKSPQEETSDLCVKAYDDLASSCHIDNRKIDCIIVCTQNPDGGGIPHVSAIVQAKLGLPITSATFDISLGCSGYVYSLSIITSFMEANGFKHGLLFTSDPYSKILDASDHNTELLFGDAATVTYLTNSLGYQTGKTSFGSDGTGGSAIQINTNTDYLEMNGRSVFMFTMKVVPEQINECIINNNTSITDIDYFLLHQGSKYIIDNMTKELGLPPGKTPFLASHYGNTVSSSIPLMLKNIMQKNPEKVLLSGFGVGLSWATTIINRTA